MTPSEMSVAEIMEEAQHAVAIFEDPLPFLLQPCTEEEVARIRTIDDPTRFTAWVYWVVRRAEAAAAANAGNKNPKVVAVCTLARELIPSIEAMRQRAETLEVKTEAEEAGIKGFVLHYLIWALRILNEQLPVVWGY